MKFNAKELYPTPEHLLDKITEGFRWTDIKSMLEPSAGKGDIVDFVRERYKRSTYGNVLDIDCIEIDSELRSTLAGKGYRVVHDNFLTFQTFKQYDLILMNPPFSNGAAHLLKALDIQKNGGAILCILNAETIRNPYTNERKLLVKRLEDLKASMEYRQAEFETSEHPTKVEIAVIKVDIPKKEIESRIYEGLKKKYFQERFDEDAPTELAFNDKIKVAIQSYNLEVESGIQLIREYKAMCPYLLDDLRGENSYKQPIINLKLNNGKDLSVNSYVREVRKKYWKGLFQNPVFTKNMTSNMLQEYMGQVDELSDYDFSSYNICRLQIEMSKNLIKGIEECIVSLFDELSHQYSYSDELKNNIHYYNGWKTNKAWYINKKVILPWMDAWNYSGRFNPTWKVRSKLADIEKALNYLDGGRTGSLDLDATLRYAEQIGQTKKIRLKYFFATFYKKGTCHVEFIDEELLKKFNIFGSQQKGWLPPGYGKKFYQDMSAEEQAVVDEFEGEKNYAHTIRNADYFIYDPRNTLKMIEQNE